MAPFGFTPEASTSWTSRNGRTGGADGADVNAEADAEAGADADEDAAGEGDADADADAGEDDDAVVDTDAGARLSPHAVPHRQRSTMIVLVFTGLRGGGGTR